MPLSYAEAEAAIKMLEAWCDDKATASQRGVALRTLESAIASGIQENITRFREARRMARPGMDQRSWELRAITGMRLAIDAFRNASQAEI